ncbi:N-formylglutamate amidohydrolase [Thiocapsa rosea]|uniref:Putative N-formylglutamate amidohydrolase n=1 Tax=Thiocapsa rosea TaxID=69360 RepID=A0A495V4C6_9GAMM|nr:N-formylglutamate amidohydrolase [Thiocapsa rosea]RKT44261.1 putative N-formylglutamate amidohydrolase [Thiocapsa rosea]
MSAAPRSHGVPGLLDPDEPPAFEIVNAAGAGSAVLVCDHASNRIPLRLGTLGLAPEQLADHIGWDPGAAEVARRLSGHLDAPLVSSGYSRLVIDCNRPLANTGSIAEESAGVPVPGNLGLSAEARAVRVETLFQPYHEAIDRLLDTRSNRPSLLLSIHSFTPVLNGEQRPWPVGVSHWRDRRFAALLSKALVGHVDGIVGDNQPYPIEEAVDYTVPVHGEGRGLHAIMIEIRNDGLRTTAQFDAWAERLAAAYREIEADALKLGRSRADI